MLRNGQWLRNVTDQTSFSERSATGTDYVLRVREGATSFDETCEVSESGEFGVGPATCRIVEGDPNVLQFSGELGHSVQLRQNNTWVANVTQFAEFEVDETEGYEIRVFGGRFDGDTTCSTDPLPPQPQAQVCTVERTGSNVALSFDLSLIHI